MRYDKHGRRKAAQKSQQSKSTAQEGDVGALKEFSQSLLQQLATQRGITEAHRHDAECARFEAAEYEGELLRANKVATKLHLVYFSLGLAFGGLVMGVIRPALAHQFG